MICEHCKNDVTAENVHLVSIARQGHLEAKIETCSRACAEAIVVAHQHPERMVLVSGPEFVTVTA